MTENGHFSRKLRLQNTFLKHQNKKEVSFWLITSRQFVGLVFLFPKRINISVCNEWLTRYDAANFLKFGIFLKFKKLHAGHFDFLDISHNFDGSLEF